MVYLITCEETQRCKIGFTKGSGKARLGQLRTSSPYDLKLRAFIDGSVETERQLHKRFSHLHVAREWFILCDEITLYFDSVMAHEMAIRQATRTPDHEERRNTASKWVEWTYNETLRKWEREQN